MFNARDVENVGIGQLYMFLAVKNQTVSVYLWHSEKCVVFHSFDIYNFHNPHFLFFPLNKKKHQLCAKKTTSGF